MSQLDLVIIHPGAVHGIYGKLGDDLVAIEPPLWPRLIAGYVRDRGYTVQIIDAEALNLSPEMVAHDVVRLHPRLVAIASYGHQPSASTQQMVGAGETAKQIKRRWPESEIIMLGGHVSALPERTMREEQIDYACVGEGPITIVGLLEGRPPAHIDGLVYYNSDFQDPVNNGRIIVNKRATEAMLDLNHLVGQANRSMAVFDRS